METCPVIATIGIESIMRVDQAGRQVGRAGPGSGAADADFAGGARVTFGGEGRILLVAHQHVADVVVVQNIVKGSVTPPG